MADDTKDEYNFYNRMNQVASYTYSNKMDTVFVFQLTFICLLVFIVLYYLAKNNVISFTLVWGVSILLGLFVVFVVIVRFKTSVTQFAVVPVYVPLAV